MREGVIINTKDLDARAALLPSEVKVPSIQRLMNGYILVQPIQSRKHGNIHLPDKASRETKFEGIVVFTGEPRKQWTTTGANFPVPHTVQVGDRVVINPVSMLPMQIDTVEYVAVQEEGIVCVLPPLPLDSKVGVKPS